MGEEGRVASGMGEEGSNEGWVRRGGLPQVGEEGSNEGWVRRGGLPQGWVKRGAMRDG